MADALWKVPDLAAYLGLAPSTVVGWVTKAPHRLPPRVDGLPPRWVPATVHAWCEAKSCAAPKSGRPRKSA